MQSSKNRFVNEYVWGPWWFNIGSWSFKPKLKKISVCHCHIWWLNFIHPYTFFVTVFVVFSSEWLAGSPHLDTSHWLYLWLYLVFYNGVSALIPLVMLAQSLPHISLAFSGADLRTDVTTHGDAGGGGNSIRSMHKSKYAWDFGDITVLNVPRAYRF